VKATPSLVTHFLRVRARCLPLSHTAALTAPATVEKLHSMQVKTGLVTNADSRICAPLFRSTSHTGSGIKLCVPVDALEDLGAAKYLDPILISEREGDEKPSMGFFLRAATRGGVEHLGEMLHVGDELEKYACFLSFHGSAHHTSHGSDYHGAWNANIPALLLRRRGRAAPTHVEDVQEGEDLSFVDVVHSLYGVVKHIERQRRRARMDEASERRHRRLEKTN
jgi:hypothetical protein